MLTLQALQQLILDSPVAAQFFADAHLGLFFDPQYHDLYFDKATQALATHHGYDSHFPQQTDQELVCRIHGQERTDYLWPDIDFKQFVSFCLQEYDRYFQDRLLPQHDHAETENKQQIQQIRERAPHQEEEHEELER